ncbi:MAG: hypothetical protein KDD69_06135, partial [Bdellovibrionales bacterium]|nr:hypothetical protein [Bdellovibrionales bacterium]
MLLPTRQLASGSCPILSGPFDPAKNLALLKCCERKMAASIGLQQMCVGDPGACVGSGAEPVFTQCMKDSASQYCSRIGNPYTDELCLRN